MKKSSSSLSFCISKTDILNIKNGLKKPKSSRRVRKSTPLRSCPTPDELMSQLSNLRKTNVY